MDCNKDNLSDETIAFETAFTCNRIDDKLKNIKAILSDIEKSIGEPCGRYVNKFTITETSFSDLNGRLVNYDIAIDEIRNKLLIINEFLKA